VKRHRLGKLVARGDVTQRGDPGRGQGRVARGHKERQHQHPGGCQQLRRRHADQHQRHEEHEDLAEDHHPPPIEHIREPACQQRQQHRRQRRDGGDERHHRGAVGKFGHHPRTGDDMDEQAEETDLDGGQEPPKGRIDKQRKRGFPGGHDALLSSPASCRHRRSGSGR